MEYKYGKKLREEKKKYRQRIRGMNKTMEVNWKRRWVWKKKTEDKIYKEYENLRCEWKNKFQLLNRHRVWKYNKN